MRTVCDCLKSGDAMAVISYKDHGRFYKLFLLVSIMVVPLYAMMWTDIVDANHNSTDPSAAIWRAIEFGRWTIVLGLLFIANEVIGIGMRRRKPISICVHGIRYAPMWPFASFIDWKCIESVRFRVPMNLASLVITCAPGGPSDTAGLAEAQLTSPTPQAHSSRREVYINLRELEVDPRSLFLLIDRVSNIRGARTDGDLRPVIMSALQEMAHGESPVHRARYGNPGESRPLGEDQDAGNPTDRSGDGP